MRGKDWAKLHDHWYRDAKLKRLMREYGPIAGAYWCYLIAVAHNASHHLDNPTGIIVDTSIALIADDLNDRHDRTEMFKAMHNRKLINIRGESWQTDNEASIDIELSAFAKNQTPKGSRQARRYAKETKGESLQGNVRQVVNSVRLCPPDIDRDIDRDRDKPSTPSAPARTSAPVPTREAHPAITTAIKTLAAHIQEDEEVWTDRIFVWWSANSHTTEGDLVAALLAVTTQPREKLKNPYRYFQTIVKRENGETRKVDQQVAEAAKRETGTERQRPWQEVWAERLKEIEDKERGIR